MRANSTAAAPPVSDTSRLILSRTHKMSSCPRMMITSFDKRYGARNRNARHPGVGAIGRKSCRAGVVDRIGNHLHAAVSAAEITVQLHLLRRHVNSAGHRRRSVAIELLKR